MKPELLDRLGFVHPHVLWLLLVIPLATVGMFFYDWMRRQQLAGRLGELPVLMRVTATASPERRVAKLVLQTIAMASIVITLARPVTQGERSVELRGLDLAIAIDVSKSMLVDDVGLSPLMAEKHQPANRLGRARDLAGAVIDELSSDRIAPVVFAGAASHFPLTEDHEVAIRFLNDLGPADLPQGSNLAEVFRVTRCLLRPDLYDDLGCARIGRRGHGGDPLPGDKEGLDPVGPKAEASYEEKVERGKAVLIFTDGGDSDAETLREVATARELGIAIFVVGLGSTQGGVVHEIDGEGKVTADAKRTADGTTVVSKRDDAGMKRIAEAGGDAGRYFVAAERGDVDPMPIVAALRQINRGLATKKVAERHDIFQPYLFAALMFLVIAAAIGTRRRQRFPEEHA